MARKIERVRDKVILVDAETHAKIVRESEKTRRTLKSQLAVMVDYYISNSVKT